MKLTRVSLVDRPCYSRYVRQENLTTDYSQVCTPVLTYVVPTLLARSEGQDGLDPLRGPDWQHAHSQQPLTRPGRQGILPLGRLQQRQGEG